MPDSLVRAGLQDSLAQELIKPTLDLAQDYAEISLDSILDSDLLKEIPLVKTAVAVFRTGVAIRERHFVKKLLFFLQEFHTGSAGTQEEDEFKKRMNADRSFRERVVEHLLVMIDRFVAVEKAQILAHLFTAHINGNFDWNEFVSVSISLDALQPRGFEFLRRLSGEKTPFAYNGGNLPEEGLLFAAGIATRHGTLCRVTQLGQKLYQFGIEPSFKTERTPG